ncbi:MAG: hypothetical protein AB1921_12200 [Thermodesulfobacteriota bacterium]
MKNDQGMKTAPLGEGIVLSRLAPYVDAFLNTAVRDYEILHQEEALPEDGRPLVFIAAHGPLWAPLPSILILGKLFVDKGLGHLVAGFYPHPMLMRFPGMKALFGRLGTPTKVYDLPGLVERLQDGRINITGTGPEGIFCHFSWEDPVGPFDNAGMVAAAVLSDATLCLLAHRGGEAWNIPLRLPFGLTVPLSRGLRGVNFPLGPVRKIKHYVVSCKRYVPELTKEKLLAAEGREKRLLIGLESERIRVELNRMMDELARRNP